MLQQHFSGKFGAQPTSQMDFDECKEICESLTCNAGAMWQFTRTLPGADLAALSDAVAHEAQILVSRTAQRRCAVEQWIRCGQQLPNQSRQQRRLDVPAHRDPLARALGNDVAPCQANQWAQHSRVMQWQHNQCITAELTVQWDPQAEVMPWEPGAGQDPC